MTAKDLLKHPKDSLDGEPGDISMDQLLARDLKLNSLETMVHTSPIYHMRGRPFATGPRKFKTPLVGPDQAWDKVFKGFSPNPGDSAAHKAMVNRLKSNQSVLDDLGPELKRFRSELSGIEKVKLDIHEDAIRSAEKSVAADIAAAAKPQAPSCTVPKRQAVGAHIPTRAKAHFDVMYAALACNRVQVGGLVWGFSGYHWRYEWVSGMPKVNTIHDEVHHLASKRRNEYIKSGHWDWSELGKFVARLKATPEEAARCWTTLLFWQSRILGIITN